MMKILTQSYNFKGSQADKRERYNGKYFSYLGGNNTKAKSNNVEIEYDVYQL